VVVNGEDISGPLFVELQSIHDQIARLDTPWAIQLEGSYISQYALRRFDPEHADFPNIERGFGERLKMVYHDDWWTIHRHILRERGITIFGPPPLTLIDPVSPDDLRRAVLALLHAWAERFLAHPGEIRPRGYQSYIVLSLCRSLYTLQYGDVVSKPVAASWFQRTQGGSWNSLIQRARVGRHNGGLDAEPEDVNGTLAFIRYTLERSKQFDMRMNTADKTQSNGDDK